MNRTILSQVFVQASPPVSLCNGSPEVAAISFTAKKKTLPRQGFYYAKSD